MDDAPRISDAEWLVMESLWDRHPATAQEVAGDVGPTNGWSEPTASTWYFTAGSAAYYICIRILNMHPTDY